MTAPKVAVVDYGMGNQASLRNALQHLGADVVFAAAPDLRGGSHVVLPGVGAFPEAMRRLRSMGFEDELRAIAAEGTRPLLGICLGMQLLATRGEEHGDCEGIGLVPGAVVQIAGEGVRVPHMGWNDTTPVDGSALGGAGEVHYYVHSFHFVADDQSDVALLTDYGGPMVAGVQRGHTYGVQFHPEKSHADGLAVLRRFLEL